MMTSLEDYRPIPFYFLNTTCREELSREAAREAMARLKAAGFGGCVLFNKPPTGFRAEEYLSDYWFEVTENFVLAARELGLALWINDGFDFPPGDAAGRIEQRDPSLCQHYLVKGTDGRVEVKAADWGFPAFEEPESSRLFIELVYEEYFRRLGQYFGNGITGIFSDADNRRYNFFTTAKLKRYYPWSRDFSALFRAKFGYAVESHLPDILAELPGQAAKDYWELAGELYQNWFRNNFEWCHAHGLKYMFHTSDTGPFSIEECPRSSVFTEGSQLRLSQFCDYPGTDHEILALDGGTHYDRRLFFPAVTRGGRTERLVNPDFAETRFDLRAKYVASAAFLNGQERVMCEAFAATNWGANPQDLRRIAAWQLMQGINLFIPHAVHHRFFGSTKYFAPPEFLHGSLRHGVREFNDWLAKFSFIAAQGEYAATIAVIDPTPEVWAGKSGAAALMKIGDRLNRLPFGYVICDRESAKRFPMVIDPALPLPELPVPEVEFDGGTLAYLPRRLADGTKYWLAANLWSDHALQGTLSYAGRRVELELEPGEIAVIGGPWEEYRTPRRSQVVEELAGAWPVEWGAPNLVPFRQDASWENVTGLPELRLLVPAALTGTVRVNGEMPQAGEPINVFDDAYVSYPVSGATGLYELHLERLPEYSEPVYLTGEFDVELETVRDFFRQSFQLYHLAIFEPESELIRLKPRSRCLEPGSWAEQGAPFYSGSATYRLELSTECGQAELELPEACGTVEAILDGRNLGKCIWPPYRFQLGKLSGRHELRLRCHNTLANQLEGYRAPGGLLGPVRLISEENR